MNSLDPAAEHASDATHPLHDDPHALWGAHTETDAAGRSTTTIRARRIAARSVTAAFADGTRWELVQVDPGVWQVAYPGPPRMHRVITVYDDGTEHISDHHDPNAPAG